jgi:PAS domain S-box-containing protein
VSFSEGRFRESDAQVLSLMAAMVAPALQAARLTERVKRQDAMIRQTYEALPVAVVVFDRSGQAVYHNQVAETVLGSDMVADIRARTVDLYDEEGMVLSPEHRPTSRALQAKAPIRNTVVGVGEEPRRWFLLDAVPILDDAGDVESLVTSAIEITSLKAAEEGQRDDAERLRLMIQVQSVLGDAEVGATRIMEIVATQAIELTGAAGAAVQMLDGARGRGGRGGGIRQRPARHAVPDQGQSHHRVHRRGHPAEHPGRPGGSAMRSARGADHRHSLADHGPDSMGGTCAGWPPASVT